MSGKTDRTPCIDRCEYSGPKGWCLGCGRTRQETRDWKSLKPFARKKILNELRKRMSRIQVDQATREPTQE